MADTHSKAVRSYNMSRIRSKDTRPEMQVRRYLFARGFRYRLHDSHLPGKPDLVLPKYRTVIFIHGCFWHAHQNCRYAVTPKSNTSYWSAKIAGNAARDAAAAEKLIALGWKSIIIWECQLKKGTADAVLNELAAAILK